MIHDKSNITVIRQKMFKGRNIGHINVNHLYNKMIDINYILQTYNPCILTINETWLNSNIHTSELFIDNRYVFLPHQ